MRGLPSPFGRLRGRQAQQQTRQGGADASTGTSPEPSNQPPPQQPTTPTTAQQQPRQQQQEEQVEPPMMQYQQQQEQQQQLYRTTPQQQQQLIQNRFTSKANARSDAAITSTASDAVLSKLNACTAGYYDDIFIRHFARDATGLTCTAAAAEAGCGGGAVSSSLSPLGGGGAFGHAHQQQQQNPHSPPRRAFSSPPDSSSSAASSFHDDLDDDCIDGLDRRRLAASHQRHHHNPLSVMHPFMHQLGHSQGPLHLNGGPAHSHVGFGRPPSAHHNNNLSPPLAGFKMEEIHPALRGRLRGGPIGGGGLGIVGMGHPQHPQPQSGRMQGQPIIRRGTHARVCVIDRAVSSFLGMPIDSNNNNGRSPTDDGMEVDGEGSGGIRQVVILGAGRDTSYLRYVAGLLVPSTANTTPTTSPATTGAASASAASHDTAAAAAEAAGSVHWYEVDQPTVIQTKLDLLKSCPLLDVTVVEECNSRRGDKQQLGDEGGVGAFGAEDSSYRVDVRLRRLDTNGSAGQPAVGSAAGLAAGSTAASAAGAVPCPTDSIYHLIPHDLRSPPSQLFAKLRGATSSSSSHDGSGFDPNQPSLFVMECVQMYLPDDAGRNLLREIASTFGGGRSGECLIVMYEPIIGTDGFGKVMESNLTRAGVVLGDGTTRGGSGTDDNQQQQLCLTRCRTLDDHLDRLIDDCGWDVAVGTDMLSAYGTVVTDRQRSRAESVEMLDELEEWRLIMGHYCFVVGGVVASGGGARSTTCTGSGFVERFCSVAGGEGGVEVEASPLGFVDGRCHRRFGRCFSSR